MRLARWAAPLALAVAGCSVLLPPPPEPVDERPAAFRSVLDGRPRVLTVELGDDLWAAYDTQSASLYKVWRDGVDLEGAVYDYRHGPQPVALGPAYVLRSGRTAWRLRVDGERVRPQVQYRGHREEADGVVLLSSLSHGELVVDVEEKISRGAGSAPSVVWRYRTGRVPPGVGVEHELGLGSLAGPLESGGAELRAPSDDLEQGRGYLALVPEQDAWVQARFGSPAIEEDPPAEVDEGWERFDQSGCASCHALEARTVGPSLLDIAERYDADEDVVSALADKVRTGGSGAWGEAAMPANDFLSDEEARQLVSFVLAFDGDDAAAQAFAAGRRGDGGPSLLWLVTVAPWYYGVPYLAGVIGDSVDALFDPTGRRPGHGEPLAGVHPSFDLEQIRPDDFRPKVGGMDFLSDGTLVVSTWDEIGAVYRVEGATGEGPDDVRAKRIAWGLAEPLGVRVVDDEIFVLQKQELTRLVDADADGRVETYEAVSNDWEVSGNFHEFAFGLAPADGGFYLTLASGVVPGGNSATGQPADRGSVQHVSRDGTATTVARGFRTPNGVGVGPNGALFVADNQGAWLPASKIVHVRPGRFYGFRDVDPDGDATRQETPPVVWLPQDEIGNSPTEPVSLDLGPYRGQLLYGDVTHGGIKRVALDEVGGELQGAVFRFSQGLEAGVNRMRWGPDGKLYVGGIGNPGNWQQFGKKWFGLERLAFNGDATFEMLAVRATPGGMEIEWTEPLRADVGTDAGAYRIEQWRYEPTADYGGPKVDEVALEVTDVELSEDRRRARLSVPGLRPGSVVHVRLDPRVFFNDDGASLWSTEAWYTLNRLPTS